MKSYERRSLLTFMTLYLGGILLMSTMIFWWYTHKETRRIHQEQKISIKLYETQCKRLLKNAPEGFEYPVKKPDFSDDLDALYHELIIAGLLILVLGTLFSYFLARISLRPMREAIKMMDNFAQSMIHDLNTPITTAHLNATALSKQDLNTSQKKRVKRIIQSLQMLQSLEERLKHAIVHAKIDYHDQKLSLCTLAKQHKEYSALIHIECTNNIIVMADKVMLTRLLDNLISNAIKYNQNNHPIEIILSGTQLSIKDHGVGINHPEQIFEPYYREKSSMPGLGLGLGIVKEVCDHYNINIDIQSIPNIGTTITLNFVSICLQPLNTQ